MYGFLMATRNTCLGLSSLGRFVNTYLLKGTSSVWIGKRHFREACGHRLANPSEFYILGCHVV